jgi:hypothetical protein
LWNPQLQLAHTRDECPAVVAGSISLPVRCPLALFGSEHFLHLGFHHLLEDLPDQRSQEILLPANHLFPVQLVRVILLSGHLLSFLSAVNGTGKGLSCPLPLLQTCRADTAGFGLLGDQIVENGWGRK